MSKESTGEEAGTSGDLAAPASTGQHLSSQSQTTNPDSSEPNNSGRWVSPGRNQKRILEPESENSRNSDEHANNESDSGLDKYQKESKRPKSESPEEATSAACSSSSGSKQTIKPQEDNHDSDNGSEVKTDQDDDDTMSKSDKSESFDTRTAAKTKKPTTPESLAPAKLTDPSSEEYWRNIYNTEFFKEKSLKIFDIIGKEFGYSKSCGRVNLFTKKKHAQSTIEFAHKAIGSLSHVQRMKLLHSLNYHDGCVNSLNFNRIGTLLASGSDDFHVGIWDWSKNTLILTFDSGHKSNVFQTKFMPFTGDSQIVTCARDGQVRLALISTSGSHIGTKKLAKHTDSCHKLSIECKIRK
jgi:hypothetical protein